MQIPTAIAPSFVRRVGSPAIIICGFVFTVVWVSLVAYGSFLLVTLALDWPQL